MTATSSHEEAVGTSRTSAQPETDQEDEDVKQLDKYVEIIQSPKGVTRSEKTSAVVNGWRKLVQIYVEKSPRNFSVIFDRLYLVTARLILRGDWYSAITENNYKNGDVLNNDLLASLNGIISEAAVSHPKECEFCQSLKSLLDKSPWSVPYISEIFSKTSDTSGAVTKLWTEENETLLDVRLDCLCQAKEYTKAFNLAQACFTTMTAQQKVDTIDKSVSDPVELEKAKRKKVFLDELTNLFYLFICKTFSNERDKYFSVTTALTVLRNISEVHPQRPRLAPKYKEWKKALKVLSGSTADFYLKQHYHRNPSEETEGVREEVPEVDAIVASKIFNFWIEHSIKGQDEEIRPVKELFDQIDKLSTDIIYIFADVLYEKFFSRPTAVQKSVELYFRAMSQDINHIEKLEVESQKEQKQALRNQLAERYLHLANMFSSDEKISWELTLTAFSLSPSEHLFKQLFPHSFTSPLEAGLDEKDKCTAIAPSNEKPVVNLTHALNEDLQTVIANPRWKSLCWAKDKEELERLCRQQLDTGGPKIKAKEDLTHLHIDYENYEPRKSADMDLDDEDTGFEKGYEPQYMTDNKSRGKRGKARKSILMKKAKKRTIAKRRPIPTPFNKRGRKNKFGKLSQATNMVSSGKSLPGCSYSPSPLITNGVAKKLAETKKQKILQNKQHNELSQSPETLQAMKMKINLHKRFGRKKPVFSTQYENRTVWKLNSFMKHLPYPKQYGISEEGKLVLIPWDEHKNSANFTRFSGLEACAGEELETLDVSSLHSPDFNSKYLIGFEEFAKNFETGVYIPSNFQEPSPGKFLRTLLEKNPEAGNTIKCSLDPTKPLLPTVKLERIVPQNLVQTSATNLAFNYIIVAMNGALRAFSEACRNPSISQALSGAIQHQASSLEPEESDLTSNPQNSKKADNLPMSYTSPPSPDTIIPKIIKEACENSNGRFSAWPRSELVPPPVIPLPSIDSLDAVPKPVGPKCVKKLVNQKYIRRVLEKTKTAMSETISAKGQALGLQFVNGHLVSANPLDTDLGKELFNNSDNCSGKEETDAVEKLGISAGVSNLKFIQFESYIIAQAMGTKMSDVQGQHVANQGSLCRTNKDSNVEMIKTSAQATAGNDSGNSGDKSNNHSSKRDICESDRQIPSTASFPISSLSSSTTCSPLLSSESELRKPNSKVPLVCDIIRMVYDDRVQGRTNSLLLREDDENFRVNSSSVEDSAQSDLPHTSPGHPPSDCEASEATPNSSARAHRKTDSVVRSSCLKKQINPEEVSRNMKKRVSFVQDTKFNESESKTSRIHKKIKLRHGVSLSDSADVPEKEDSETRGDMADRDKKSTSVDKLNAVSDIEVDDDSCHLRPDRINEASVVASFKKSANAGIEVNSEADQRKTPTENSLGSKKIEKRGRKKKQPVVEQPVVETVVVDEIGKDGKAPFVFTADTEQKDQEVSETGIRLRRRHPIPQPIPKSFNRRKQKQNGLKQLRSPTEFKRKRVRTVAARKQENKKMEIAIDSLFAGEPAFDDPVDVEEIEVGVPPPSPVLSLSSISLPQSVSPNCEIDPHRLLPPSEIFSSPVTQTCENILKPASPTSLIIPHAVSLTKISPELPPLANEPPTRSTLPCFVVETCEVLPRCVSPTSETISQNAFTTNDNSLHPLLPTFETPQCSAILCELSPPLPLASETSLRPISPTMELACNLTSTCEVSLDDVSPDSKTSAPDLNPPYDDHSTIISPTRQTVCQPVSPTCPESSSSFLETEMIVPSSELEDHNDCVNSEALVLDKLTLCNHRAFNTETDFFHHGTGLFVSKVSDEGQSLDLNFPSPEFENPLWSELENSLFASEDESRETEDDMFLADADRINTAALLKTQEKYTSGFDKEKHQSDSEAGSTNDFIQTCEKDQPFTNNAASFPKQKTLLESGEKEDAVVASVELEVDHENEESIMKSAKIKKCFVRLERLSPTCFEKSGVELPKDGSDHSQPLGVEKKHLRDRKSRIDLAKQEKSFLADQVIPHSQQEGAVTSKKKRGRPKKSEQIADESTDVTILQETNSSKRLTRGQRSSQASIQRKISSPSKRQSKRKKRLMSDDDCNSVASIETVDLGSEDSDIDMDSANKMTTPTESTTEEIIGKSPPHLSPASASVPSLHTTLSPSAALSNDVEESPRPGNSQCIWKKLVHANNLMLEESDAEQEKLEVDPFGDVSDSSKLEHLDDEEEIEKAVLIMPDTDLKDAEDSSLENHDVFGELEHQESLARQSSVNNNYLIVESMDDDLGVGTRAVGVNADLVEMFADESIVEHSDSELAGTAVLTGKGGKQSLLALENFQRIPKVVSKVRRARSLREVVSGKEAILEDDNDASLEGPQFSDFESVVGGLEILRDNVAYEIEELVSKSYEQEEIDGEKSRLDEVVLSDDSNYFPSVTQEHTIINLSDSELEEVEEEAVDVKRTCTGLKNDNKTEGENTEFQEKGNMYENSKRSVGHTSNSFVSTSDQVIEKTASSLVTPKEVPDDPVIEQERSYLQTAEADAEDSSKMLAVMPSEETVTEGITEGESQEETKVNDVVNDSHFQSNVKQSALFAENEKIEHSDIDDESNIFCLVSPQYSTSPSFPKDEALLDESHSGTADEYEGKDGPERNLSMKKADNEKNTENGITFRLYHPDALHLSPGSLSQEQCSDAESINNCDSDVGSPFPVVITLSSPAEHSEDEMDELESRVNTVDLESQGIDTKTQQFFHDQTENEPSLCNNSFEITSGDASLDSPTRPPAPPEKMCIISKTQAKELSKPHCVSDDSAEDFSLTMDMVNCPADDTYTDSDTTALGHGSVSSSVVTQYGENDQEDVEHHSAERDLQDILCDLLDRADDCMSTIRRPELHAQTESGSRRSSCDTAMKTQSEPTTLMMEDKPMSQNLEEETSEDNLDSTESLSPASLGEILTAGENIHQESLTPSINDADESIEFKSEEEFEAQKEGTTIDEKEDDGMDLENDPDLLLVLKPPTPFEAEVRKKEEQDEEDVERLLDAKTQQGDANEHMMGRSDEKIYGFEGYADTKLSTTFQESVNEQGCIAENDSVKLTELNSSPDITPTKAVEVIVIDSSSPEKSPASKKLIESQTESFRQDVYAVDSTCAKPGAQSRSLPRPPPLMPAPPLLNVNTVTSNPEQSLAKPRPRFLISRPLPSVTGNDGERPSETKNSSILQPLTAMDPAVSTITSGAAALVKKRKPLKVRMKRRKTSFASARRKRTKSYTGVGQVIEANMPVVPAEGVTTREEAEKAYTKQPVNVQAELFNAEQIKIRVKAKKKSAAAEQIFSKAKRSCSSKSQTRKSCPGICESTSKINALSFGKNRDANECVSVKNHGASSSLDLSDAILGKPKILLSPCYLTESVSKKLTASTESAPLVGVSKYEEVEEIIPAQQKRRSRGGKTLDNKESHEVTKRVRKMSSISATALPCNRDGLVRSACSSPVLKKYRSSQNPEPGPARGQARATTRSHNVLKKKEIKPELDSQESTKNEKRVTNQVIVKEKQEKSVQKQETEEPSNILNSSSTSEELPDIPGPTALLLQIQPGTSTGCPSRRSPMRVYPPHPQASMTLAMEKVLFPGRSSISEYPVLEHIPVPAFLLEEEVVDKEVDEIFSQSTLTKTPELHDGEIPRKSTKNRRKKRGKFFFRARNKRSAKIRNSLVSEVTHEKVKSSSLSVQAVHHLEYSASPVMNNTSHMSSKISDDSKDRKRINVSSSFPHVPFGGEENQVKPVIATLGIDPNIIGRRLSSTILGRTSTPRHEQSSLPSKSESDNSYILRQRHAVATTGRKRWRGGNIKKDQGVESLPALSPTPPGSPVPEEKMKEELVRTSASRRVRTLLSKVVELESEVSSDPSPGKNNRLLLIKRSTKSVTNKNLASGSRQKMSKVQPLSFQLSTSASGSLEVTSSGLSLHDMPSLSAKLRRGKVETMSSPAFPDLSPPTLSKPEDDDQVDLYPTSEIFHSRGASPLPPVLEPETDLTVSW